MAEVKSTRLRVVRSKDLPTALAFISNLGFKVEYKETLHVKGFYEIFFVPPDHDTPAIKKMGLVTTLEKV